MSISRVAIDADMDGRFRADCFTTGAKAGSTLCTIVTGADGQRVAESIVPAVDDSLRIDMSCGKPKLWTAETPHLYTAEFVLADRRGRVILATANGLASVRWRCGVATASSSTA